MKDKNLIGIITLIGLIAATFWFLYEPLSLMSSVCYFIICIALGVLCGKTQEKKE